MAETLFDQNRLRTGNLLEGQLVHVEDGQRKYRTGLHLIAQDNRDIEFPRRPVALLDCLDPERRLIIARVSDIVYSGVYPAGSNQLMFVDKIITIEEILQQEARHDRLLEAMSTHIPLATALLEII